MNVRWVGWRACQLVEPAQMQNPGQRASRVPYRSMQHVVMRSYCWAGLSGKLADAGA